MNVKGAGAQRGLERCRRGPCACGSAFPLHADAGTKSSAVVYFEIEPGEHLGRHTDSAEEILYIVDGMGEAEVGGERVELDAGTLALGAGARSPRCLQHR